jgi:hypothetical protein
MSRSANVRSIAALKEFRGSLGKFAEQTSLSLDEALGETQRALHWLREDCFRYWKKQAFERHEAHVQAKLNLKRKKIFDRTLQGSPSSCIDERKALKKAELRLEMAQRKLKRTRYWIQQLDRDAADFKGIIQGLRSMVDADLPQARARLDNMIHSLEAYVRLAPPARAVPGDELAPEESFATTAESTVRSPTEQLPGLIQQIRALRELTPSQESRDQVSVSKLDLQRLSGIQPVDALMGAIAECPQDEAGPQDKVLLRLDLDQLKGIYCERAPSGQGDSGWTLRSTDPNAEGDYAAVNMAELLGVCPLLQRVLTLPVGYFVLLDHLDQAEQTQALADGHDKLIWSTKLEGSAK